jgi:hypothetical protein
MKLVWNIENFNYFINEHEILSEKIDEILKDDYNSLSQSCRDVIFNHINSKFVK